MDFGLAKLVGKTRLTKTDTVMGTVDYMSPEQARGDPVDHRTDIWSLGVVLYEMLTGQLPFKGQSAQTVIYCILNEDAQQMAYWRPEIPAVLDQAVRKMMRKDPLKRYEDMSAVLTDLRTLKEEPAALLVSDEKIAPSLVRRTPFVGRESERADLRRFLDRAKSGQGALVMIGGEPGVGKTRITEELIAEARRHGFFTLTGHCYEMEGAPPYIPFVEVIESAARIVEPDALLAALGNDAPEVSKLVPELRERFPDIPAPKQLPPEQERRRMFNGVLMFITRAAQAQPLLLVIEDLHWTDEPTLLLLQHIAQQLHEIPVLMVGTYRDTELDMARSLAKALEDLLRQRLAHDMLLKRLPQHGVTAMLRGRSGQEPPSRLVEVIYGETEGNPFFVEEIFKHLAEEEKLFDFDGNWRSDLRIDETDVPRGVLLVIGHRLERVSEECRRILARAAVIGRGVGFKLLNEVIELDEDILFDSIEEAERAQIISTRTRGAEAEITFAHELIRQTLLSELSVPRRRRLHLHVAEAMEQIYAAALEEHAADLTHHFYQAGGDTEKIIRYAVLAAERATAQTAYEEAVEQYQRALQALEQQQPVDELRRCDLLLALGHAHGDVGDPARAEKAFLRVIDIARKLPAPGQFAEAVLGVGRFSLVSDVADEKLLSLIEESLAMLPQEDNALLAALLGRLSSLLALEGLQERRIAFSEQAVAMARRVGDPQALQYALFSSLLIWEHPLAQKIADATELAKLEEETGRRAVMDQGLYYLCHYHMEQGDVAAADAYLTKMKNLGAELSDPLIMWRTTLIEGMRALMTGQFEEAERLSLEGFAFGQKVDERNAAQYMTAHIFILRRFQGRLAEIEDAWESALEQYAEAPVWRSANAWFHLELGREEQAWAELDHLAARDFSDLPKYFNTFLMVMCLSDVAAATGDTRRAALLYDLLYPYADRLLMHGVNCACHGATTHWLGLLAGTLKRWDDSVAHFEDALETNSRIGARPYLARSQHEYARMLIERNDPGDKEKAKTLLTEATATYRELGMPTFLEKAEELLGKL
jgi:tetratricopeptide (TPR) repeat protein